MKGVSGPQCDKCARGYQGEFPDCKPCHNCFAIWDTIVNELTNQTQRLEAQVSELQTSGVTAPYKDLISTLDTNIKAVKEIVENNPAVPKFEKIQDLMHQITGVMSFVNGMLNTTEKNFEVLHGNTSTTDADLKEMTTEANKLSQTVKELRQQVSDAKNANIQGAMDSISDAHMESTMAEVRTNVSTTIPGNTVETSAAVRKATEDKLGSSKKEFDRKHQRNLQKLDKLNNELNEFDLSPLSSKICGGAAEEESCSGSACGGLGCGSKDEEPQCGGEGCKSLVTSSQSALKTAKDLDQDIDVAMQEVDKLSRMVWEAKIRADEAKINALEVLKKSNESKERVEQSNNQLRELIKDIRDLLTNEKADLSVIEAVANEVLALQMPASSKKLQELTDEIKEKVSSLTSVESILTQSAQDIKSAETLLQQAKDASNEASSTKESADVVKAALEETEKAQSIAMDAIELAQNNTKGTLELLETVESETAKSELKVSNATGRLVQLEREVGLLRQNNLEIDHVLDTADKTSESAKQNAEEAEQEFNIEVKDRFEDIQDLVEDKGESVLQARVRADELQQEAKELLEQSSAKLERLKELETSYEANQKILEDKAAELAQLEEMVRLILEEISYKVTLYSTCV